MCGGEEERNEQVRLSQGAKFRRMMETRSDGYASHERIRPYSLYPAPVIDLKNDTTNATKRTHAPGISM
jgi:hypothetical protein